MRGEGAHKKGKNKKTLGFEFIEEAKKALKDLKTYFIEAPLLTYFDADLKTRIETDASGYAIAGVLS